jgi:hypothetical protein
VIEDFEVGHGGFINSFAFLERAVEKLRVQGIITDQALSAARKAQTM